MVSDSKLDLERALSRMKPKYRHVLILKYYQDMTISDIANILDVPEGTVKTRLHQGLKLLRQKSSQEVPYSMFEKEERMLKEMNRDAEISAAVVSDEALTRRCEAGCEEDGARIGAGPEWLTSLPCL